MNAFKRLGHYVMRGRLQAITVGLLLSMLPILSCGTHAVVGLVSLRQGPKEGALVLLWVMLPSVILASTVNPMLWWYSILGQHLLGYALAVLLRVTGAWGSVLEALLLLGLFLVTGVHWVVPDTSALWLQQWHHYITLLQSQMIFHIPEGLLKEWSHMATGLQLMFLFLGNLWNLWVARWMQAALYNSGQFWPELKAIRLSWASSVMMIAVVVAGGLGMKLAWDSIPIVAFIGGMAGFSIFSVGILRQVGQFWRIISYMMLLLFFSYLVWGLVVLGWIDSMLDLRKRWQYG